MCVCSHSSAFLLILECVCVCSYAQVFFLILESVLCLCVCVCVCMWGGVDYHPLLAVLPSGLSAR